MDTGNREHELKLKEKEVVLERVSECVRCEVVSREGGEGRRWTGRGEEEGGREGGGGERVKGGGGGEEGG